MTKRRVPLYGKQGFTDVDPSATNGATIGTNLYWPDGTLVNATQLSAAITAALTGATTSTTTAAGTDLLPTTWDYLLAVPANVQALEDAAGTGLFAVTGASTGAFRTITGTADRITVTDGNGVSGNPTLTIAATYPGQTSITTLGTVGTGTWQGAAVGLAYGGTGASLADPNADRLMFWDDSAGQVTWLTLGTNLSITGTTLDAAGGGGGGSTNLDGGHANTNYGGTTAIDGGGA